jgi:hypothetical protein
MEISATVVNQDGQSMVRAGDKAHSLAIPAKVGGFGSAVNGGELLFLALARSYTRRRRHIREPTQAAVACPGYAYVLAYLRVRDSVESAYP